jgi:deoxyribonuclease V
MGPSESPRPSDLTSKDDVQIACVDVDYRTNGAVAAALWFRGWQADTAERQAVESFIEVADYEPGAFYRRELPCVLGVLALGPHADVTIVDGYVWLADGARGLGAHLHTAIGGIVVGVAKTKFAGASAVPICRGGSRSPLFVTSVGVEPDVAAGWIASMHGPHRLPTLLKQVDTLARTAPAQR